MSNSHFHQPKKDWSARKHAVLRDYLPTFCTALSRQGTIWYVDGFAGAGTFRDPNNPGAPVEAGSPVLAAAIAQNLPYDVSCYNVEEDQTNYQSLVEATKQYPHLTTLYMLAGGRHTSDWVKNIERDAAVRVRIRDRLWQGAGRIMANESEEAVRARELVGPKYGEWQPGQQRVGWTWTALPVAVDLDVDD